MDTIPDIAINGTNPKLNAVFSNIGLDLSKKKVNLKDIQLKNYYKKPISLKDIKSHKKSNYNQTGSIQMKFP